MSGMKFLPTEGILNSLSLGLIFSPEILLPLNKILLINLLDTVFTSLRLFTIVGIGQSSMMFIYEALARRMVHRFM